MGKIKNVKHLKFTGGVTRNTDGSVEINTPQKLTELKDVKPLEDGDSIVYDSSTGKFSGSKGTTSTFTGITATSTGTVSGVTTTKDGNNYTMAVEATSAGDNVEAHDFIISPQVGTGSGDNGKIIFEGSNNVGLGTAATAHALSTTMTIDGSNIDLTGNLTQTRVANGPFHTIINNNNDASAPAIYLKNLRGGNNGVTNDSAGKIHFSANDAGGTEHIYGSIEGSAADATAGGEQGKIVLAVTEYDGNGAANNVTPGVTVTGGTADGVVDVSLGSGSASTTTVAGDLTLDNDLFIENTDDNAQSGEIKFNNTKGGADGDDNDILGLIRFFGKDDGTPTNQEYGKIWGEIKDASSGSEEGYIRMAVAEYDGTVTTGFDMSGSTVNGAVHVNLGSSTKSIVTSEGSLNAVGKFSRGDWEDGFHGNSTYIALTPQDFNLGKLSGRTSSDTSGTDIGESITTSSTANKPTATMIIPKGFTAQGAEVWADGTGTPTFMARSHSIINGTYPTVLTATISVNLT